jgi:hypothetical protein
LARGTGKAVLRKDASPASPPYGGERPGCQSDREDQDMIGFLAFLWFVTCFFVMGYGISNHPVRELRLPRWSSLAVIALGFGMLMSMFAFALYAEATDLSWFPDGRRFEGD